MVDGVAGDGVGGRDGEGASRGGANDVPMPGHRPAGVRLTALFPKARFVACDDIVARGCHDDPDACRPGDVFVARLDEHSDGHELAARAIARGVAGIVAERIIPTFGTPLAIVPDTDWAHARLLHALSGDPARSMTVIAITGTSGKTTTAWLAAAVLAEAGHRVGVLSDLGCLDADSAEPVAAPIDRPAVLASWLSRLAASGCSHVVVEVSSAMLASHALAGVPCDSVVVTNIASAHLDRHGTVEAYHEIKSRILECLGADGCLVANVDDVGARRLLARHRRIRGGKSSSGPSQRRAITVGLRGPADLSASAVERCLGGQTFLLRHAGDSAAVGVGTPVSSFVRDALFAVAIGLRQGLPLEIAARGIEAAGSVPGRLDRIRRGQETHVFVDQPTSGHALASTLASLRRLTPGRLVVLSEEAWASHLGGRRFADRAARWCNECLVVPAGLLDPSAGSRQLAAYARIDRLLSTLGARDCVLLIGAGLTHRPDPGDPGEPQVPLAVVVDAWLEMAHPARWPGAGRRAA